MQINAIRNMKTTTILAIVAIVAALGAAGLVTAVSFSTQAHANRDTGECHHFAHALGIHGEDANDNCSPHHP